MVWSFGPGACSEVSGMVSGPGVAEAGGAGASCEVWSLLCGSLCAAMQLVRPSARRTFAAERWVPFVQSRSDLPWGTLVTLGFYRPLIT